DDKIATKLPPSYKLSDSICKKILKKTAEPYLDHDMIYRQKQGFGAPMDEWFREGDFGARCLAAFERSALRKEGFFDDQYFTSLLKDQIAGRQNGSFRWGTAMNATFWLAWGVGGRTVCF